MAPRSVPRPMPARAKPWGEGEPVFTGSSSHRPAPRTRFLSHLVYVCQRASHTAALLRSLAGNFHNNQPISSQKPPREPSLDTYLQTNIDRQVCARHCVCAGDTEMPPSTNLPDFSTMSNIPEQMTRGILRSSFSHLCGN